MSIAAALDAWGVPYVDKRIPGRPHPFTPVGVMEHHTVSPRSSGNLPTLPLILNGRGGVQPLSAPVVQLLIGRDGTVVLCSEGHSNHAGRGEARALGIALGTLDQQHRRASSAGDVNGNTWFIGIEVENDGQGEPYSPYCTAAIENVEAALCAHYGWSPKRAVLGHKEWTSGKIDPLVSMDLRRTAVQRLLEHRNVEDDMPLNDTDLDKIRKIVAHDNEAWAKHVMNHVNGVGNDIVKRVSEGFLAALVNAVTTIKEAVK